VARSPSRKLVAASQMGDSLDHPSGPALSAREVDGLGAIGLLLAGAAAAAAITNSTSNQRFFLAAAGASTVAILVAVGLVAWRRDPVKRFGRLLVLTGFVSFLNALGASDNEVLYSVGRVSEWVFELLLIYLFLSYPSGRLQGGPERWIFGIATVEVAVLWLPTALLAGHYPTPSLTCNSDCPGNAFQIANSEPGFVESIIRPARELITIGIWAATLAVLASRLRAASPSVGRGLTPVLGVLMARLAVTAAFLGARRAGAGDQTLELLASLVLLSVPATALGFVAGRIRWWFHGARVLESLALEGRDVATLRELRDHVADALSDPTLEIRYPEATGGWRDVSGRRVAPPERATGRCLVEITADGEVVGAILCDVGLEDHRELVEAAGGWIRSAIERERLTAALDASLKDVEASRRRISAAAAAERRLIERDLHDGAQQQLVTLRVQIELAADEFERDPDRAAQRLRELGPSVDAVIEEVRSLASGIYPALLADAGLGEALRAVGARALLPVAVHADGRRYPLEVESGVYYCCLEALQNAAKHSGAARVSIDVTTEADRLWFAVRDDGRGFAQDNGLNGGSGLTNMRDRIASLGGTLVIQSAPGHGTQVTGEIRTAPIA
jgi:signal transduction histidine kinase